MTIRELAEKINEKHCQSCGSTDPENVDTSWDEEYQGYTRCCNERVVDRCTRDDCSHGR